MSNEDRFPYSVVRHDDQIMAHYPTLGDALNAIRQEQAYNPDKPFHIEDRLSGRLILTVHPLLQPEEPVGEGTPEYRFQTAGDFDYPPGN